MTIKTESIRVLCIGAGNMTAAIVPSFKQTITELGFAAFTPSQTRAKALMEQVDGEHLKELAGIENFDVVLLGFKPQQFETIAQEIKQQIRPGQLILSLLAGTSIESIQKQLGTTQVIRLMPNTPAQVGEGASLMAFSSDIEPQWKELGLKMLKSLGVGVEVSEDQLNTATPYSGSGPAYFFLLTQLMMEDLETRGFHKEDARKLCEQTFIGAAELLKNSDESVEVLRQKVTSKGGVTHAAVESMLASGLAKTIHVAMDEALKRNTELGK